MSKIDIYDKLIEYFHIKDLDYQHADFIGCCMPFPGTGLHSLDTAQFVNKMLDYSIGFGFGLCVFLYDYETYVIPWLPPGGDEELKPVYKELVKTGNMLSYVLKENDPSDSYFTTVNYRAGVWLPDSEAPTNDYEYHLTDIIYDKIEKEKKRKQRQKQRQKQKKKKKKK